MKVANRMRKVYGAICDILENNNVQFTKTILTDSMDDSYIDKVKNRILAEIKKEGYEFITAQNNKREEGTLIATETYTLIKVCDAFQYSMKYELKDMKNKLEAVKK